MTGINTTWFGKVFIRLAPPLALTSLLLLTTGCPHEEYTVELQPQGELIQRMLSCRRVDNDGNDTKTVEFPADELNRLKAIFPNYRYDAGKDWHVFDGVFSDQLPNDVGGAGQYRHFHTSLGSFSTYLERVRGLDDLHGRLELRLKATDQVATLITEWLQSELGQAKGFQALKQFLDGPFRKDLKNLNLYLLQVALSGKKETNALATLTARSVQYAIEHGYVHGEQAPMLLASLLEVDEEAWIKLLRACLADKLGEPVKQAFLKDQKAAVESWKAFLAKTKYYEQYAKRWEKEHAGEADAKTPTPEEAFGKLGEEAIDFSLGGGDDKLTVKLSLPVEPLQSNGAWDPDKNLVSWEAEIESKTPVQLPVICYAAWVQPDVTAQKAHFGKMVLAGDALAKYAVWRANLPAAQGAEWDKFLGGLAPGKNLEQRLDDFKFTGGGEGSGAEKAVNLIKAGLTAER
ncbi:MAG: hypothetical protein WCO56_05605 [Verrucomicrobiota bacterium]